MTPTDHHPLLGRLVHLKHPRTGAETQGQVLDFSGDRLLVKPSNSQKAFWVKQTLVHPDWVDHISEQLKHL